MNAWLDGNADGLALLLYGFLWLLALVGIAAVFEGGRRMIRWTDRNNPITRLEPRCERAGSQQSFCRVHQVRTSR